MKNIGKMKIIKKFPLLGFKATVATGLLVSLIALTSCQDEIEIDLNSSNPKVVIEGAITNLNEPNTIKITKTVNFSDPNTYPAVRGAKVTINDNLGNSEQLTETAAGVYQTKPIKGVSGRTYTLTVVAEGSTFTAQSTMPTQVKLDSLRIMPSTFAPPGGGTNDNYTVFPQFRDPAGVVNSYRFIQSSDKAKDNSILVSNDNIGDGQPYSRPIFSQGFELKKGDKYALEMQCIDKPIYEYFYTLASISGGGPGGGTTPTNPPSNISGGALGYFSAHTVQRVNVVVK
jgi:hypothetical protein